MADYKEQLIEGKSWQRAFHVEGKNEIGKPQSITYHEETACIINGEPVSIRTGQKLVVPFDPETAATDVFPMIHPVTGDQVGTMDAMTLYVALSSFYLAKAKARDEYVPPAPPTLPNLALQLGQI